MACFEGKWEGVHSENVEEYLKALGIPEKKIKDTLGGTRMISFGPFVQNSWSYKVEIGDLLRETTLKIGEEVDTVSITGQPAKSTISVEGNVMTETETVGDTEAVFKRKVSEDRLICTATRKGVTMVLRFRRI